jgi:hypothetical protein
MENPREAVCHCMQLLFDLEKTIRTHDVTIDELTHVMDLSLEYGHDLVGLALSMSAIALEQAKQNLDAAAE